MQIYASGNKYILFLEITQFCFETNNRKMNGNMLRWVLFITLSFIWGSSFILMKLGMGHLNAFQVASVRIVASGIVLLPLAVKSFKKIPAGKMWIVFFSGSLGSLLPAYLFCFAEQGIDSSLAGTLNSLTPIFVIITGAIFFQSKTSLQKTMGVLVAFSGSMMLFFTQPDAVISGNLHYVLLVMLATLFYGFNVNLVQRYLKDIPSLQIVSVALCLNAIPALIALYFFGYFSLDLMSKGVLISTGFSILLGALGTSIANILFYILIKNSGVVFAAMVTYGIPFVAILWGIVYHENIGRMQILSLCVILLGVYLANKRPSI